MLQMMMENWPWWLAFHLIVITVLVLDLGVFHKDAHEIHAKEALKMSAVWVSLALIFNAMIFWQWDSMKPSASTYTNIDAGIAFLTGYLVEMSLSVDNLFVIALVFGALKIPGIYQHRVLFWGVLGAIVMRAIMIFGGIALLDRFQWLIYVFGAFLIITGLKMALKKDDDGEEKLDLDSKWYFRLLKKRLRVTEELDGQKFWTRKNGVLMATPLFLALIMVEITDLVFAVDSIPAILAITREPFVVYTSNIFAIMGLRSFYFALAHMLRKFDGLELALAFVLVFIGIKMVIHSWIKIPSPISLAIVVSLLAWGVWRSLRKKPEDETPAA